MVTTCVDQLSNLVDADCTLSIDAASLHECVGIVSCCCDVSANTTADSAQSTERQVNQWVVRSIQLNRLVCARDSDLIGFLHSCKEVSTLTCTVRPRAEALSAHSVSEADKRCSAFEACIGALFDTDCWALCKVVMQISWTTGSVVCPDGAAAATRRTATAAVDGLFYPVGKSRALLIVDNGCSISSGSTRLALPPYILLPQHDVMVMLDELYVSTAQATLRSMHIQVHCECLRCSSFPCFLLHTHR